MCMAAESMLESSKGRVTDLESVQAGVHFT